MSFLHPHTLTHNQRTSENEGTKKEKNQRSPPSPPTDHMQHRNPTRPPAVPSVSLRLLSRLPLSSHRSPDDTPTPLTTLPDSPYVSPPWLP